MRIPSVKTLSTVFDNPKQARKILEMTREELKSTTAGEARCNGCYHSPKTYDIRLHVLSALDSGLYGVEAIETIDGAYADYLNTGDSYAPTVIYWRGNYRVQSIGSFVETMARQGIAFK